MAKSRRVVLETRVFEKAGDATAFFRGMLNRYPMGGRVSAEDALDLIALLNRHDEKSVKIGTGIAYFEVNSPPPDAPPFSDRCFWIIRTDGTRIDVSYTHCLKPKPMDEQL